jgi:FKBP-type peptidyl-prolyl cis-trans isomerase
MHQNNSSVGSAGMMQRLESRRMLSAATSISISASPGNTELGEAILVKVAVTSASRGVIRGAASIYDNGTFIAQGNINKHGVIEGTISALDNGTGGNAFYNGKNVFTARYLGSGSFNTSKTHKASDVTVSMPTLTAVKNGQGLKIANLVAGSGAAAAAGQSVTVAYTGYLTDGTMFDSSVMEINQGNSPGTLTFTLTKHMFSASVIPGFDEGVMGMQVGEERILDIPATLGYGSTANGPIPANSELIFIVTLTAE